MKVKIVLVVMISLACVSNSHAGFWDGITGTISHIKSGVKWIKQEVEVIQNIENNGAHIFEITDLKNYRVRRGGIKVCKRENRLIVGFYLSEKNINFYSQTFSDGRRKPIGFEIDVIDHSGVFKTDDIETIRMGPVNETERRVFYADNTMGDSGRTTHVFGVTNPSVLRKDRWYYVVFQFSNHTEFDGLARFTLQVQLVGDLRDLKAICH